MPFQIIRNDITKVSADAIVNTANPEPVIGGGTDFAVYIAAGRKKLLEERKKIGNIAPGQAFSTDAFRLNAKYIIHTVGPVWVDGNQGERETLRSCYVNSLNLAAELSCESIAFPLIATGVYGFPKDEALQIALSEISRFLLTHEMKVLLVVFDRRAFELSGRLVGEIEEYIDDHAVGMLREAEFEESASLRRERRLRANRRREAALYQNREVLEDENADLEEPERFFTGSIRLPGGSDFSEQKTASASGSPKQSFQIYSQPAPSAPAGAFPDVSGKSLDEIVGNTGDTFQKRLFQLIDERGLDDVTVYKKANIDRKVFSKIRCNEEYKPKKKTAVAFAIALQLDLPTMQDLLSRAEIAFSPSNKFDLIISYFVTHQIYDIYEINAALFKYGQPILGE